MFKAKGVTNFETQCNSSSSNSSGSNTHGNKLVVVHLDDVSYDHLMPQLINQFPVPQHARQPVVYMTVATVALL